ncbi:MAG: DegT/DnrJ/EryC1/StrS family aminotransferase [Candidatus Omnitrophica bacterium]|nr:DegT/DnrJ/EryC1/StrS family aminotransferase [Candidatus Omnitrophota bacterium]MBU4487478.1 DegT/DnrJ/EryC1/StrS family aminotransferase [Candidatus Omnitrophota bacterium]
MKIPIMNLSLQYEELKTDIDRVMRRIAETSSFILGKETEEFEKEIAAYCQTKYAVGVNSGTDALILALTALGIKEGDEVITTPFTFVATAEAISRVGARPVFVDIEPLTCNIDPAKIEKAVTKNTKALVPVHLFGNPCDMDSISKVAGRYKLKVIEDTAQAIGAIYKGRRVASFGDAGCLSFFPGKNLGAFGDGGMVTTNSQDIADKIRILRVHGTVAKYRHSIIGFNSRLDNLQAAILSIKLTKLDEWNEKRRRVAEKYDKALKDLVAVPRIQKDGKHVYHLYVIGVEARRRDGLVEFLNKNGVEARVYYGLPLHLQECYKGLGCKNGDFPEAEKAGLETLALPLFPELREKDQDYIIEKIRAFIRP